MLRFILKRLVLLPVLLLAFTVVVFALVQAPPGDFLTSYVAMLASSGSSMDAAQVEALKVQFGLDKPCTSSTCAGWRASSGATSACRSSTSGRTRS